MSMIGYLREVSAADLQQLDHIAGVHRLLGRDDPAALCLEKDWQAIHYLLTGSAEGGSDPLGFLMVGGREVGAETGYGRPRLFAPDDVRRLNDALRAMSDDQFWSRFDAQQFEAEQIYPGHWDDESPDELRDAFVATFHEVRDHVARVASSGGQMIFAII